MAVFGLDRTERKKKGKNGPSPTTKKKKKEGRGRRKDVARVQRKGKKEEFFRLK